MSTLLPRLSETELAALHLDAPAGATLHHFLAAAVQDKSEDTHVENAPGSSARLVLVNATKAHAEALAQAAAAALRKTLRPVEINEVSSRFIAETEKKIEELTDVAESEHWLLFFDEADALFGKRSEVENRVDRFANQETSYVLQHVDHYTGPIIFALKSESEVDTVCLKRFRWIIRFS